MSEVRTAGRKGRGGRGAKRAERAGPSVSRQPFITREIGTFDVVSDEVLDKIESASERILQEIGIEIRGDEEALRLFKDVGADVDGERVQFPMGLVRELSRTAPSVFTQHARNPLNTVQIGGEHTVFVPGYGFPFVRDRDQGRRYGSIADFEKLVKLAYMSPTLHHSGGVVCEPVDVPVNKRHLDMVYAHLRYSDKALLGGIITPERARDSIDMCRIVFGEEFVSENCVIMGNINVNSPLVYDGVVTQVIRTYAAAGQGVVVVPFILGGAMGPVTTPGAIAQAHAEALVGVALTQLVNPGAPAIYGNFLSSTALRSGSPTFGTPEPALGTLIVGQLARRAGLPLRCSGSLTSSKIADGQAMMETAISIQAAVLAGGNFILHSTGWLEGGLSCGFEKFVMDADLLGAMATYMNGFEIDDESLALDAYQEVGIGNHFFGCAHTMRHFETAFWDSELSDNQPFETWAEQGEQDLEMRANAKWKQMLADYEAPPIDPGINDALKEFVEKRKASEPDAWH